MSPEATYTHAVTGDPGPAIDVDQLVSYAVDAWVADISILTDEARLVGLLRDAATAGNATILAEATHIFPNGAVTAALVLSQSHLTIHTWPEHSLANIDLLSYGILNGTVIVEHIEQGLGASRINMSRLIRHVEPA